jgi:transcriptional regulator with XRE-family HTH domain
MINKEEVGQKIFKLRKRKGITQEKLASLVNVTPQAISKWENGVALPDTYLLPTLANLFHVNIEELLCTESEYNKENQKTKRHRVLLSNIKYYPCTPPLVGCIKSSLDYIGIHVSTGWISAPYAFMLNINDEVSYMGPEYWSDNGCIL